MAMRRSDISRMLAAGQAKIFRDNLKPAKKEQWRWCSSITKSDKTQETYDSIGNLKKAHVKEEEGNIQYGKLEQAYQTTVVNETIANGYWFTMEVEEDDLYAVVDEGQQKELPRTMQSKREEDIAAVWDAVFTATGADGVAYAANNHPLKNCAGKFNDNLAANVAPTPDAVIDANNKFNHIYRHNGELFDTDASAVLFHKDKMSTWQAIMASTLKAQELSNTKNTVPALRLIWNKYINQLYYHLIDEEIESVIMQIRRGFKYGYHVDKKDTLNTYFHVTERRKAAHINPGFGHVSSKGGEL
jgi:hypothetical protein